MSRIYWDTMLFVYWFEGVPAYAPRVGEIRASMDHRGDELLTSTFTLGELLVKPFERGAEENAAAVRAALSPPWVRQIAFTPDVAEHYARIRSRHRVTPADAIHLASAASAGVELFLTNDRALTPLRIPGIDFIAPLDVSLF
jgi:predicted nucleic acid-binding protein